MSRNPTVDIERSYYDKLSSYCKNTGSTVKRLTNSILRDYMNRRDLAAGFSDELSFVGISANRLTLRDQDTSELVDVYFEEKLLYCSKDKTNVCRHTYFALLLPELEQLKK